MNKWRNLEPIVLACYAGLNGRGQRQFAIGAKGQGTRLSNTAEFTRAVLPRLIRDRATWERFAVLAQPERLVHEILLKHDERAHDYAPREQAQPDPLAEWRERPVNEDGSWADVTMAELLWKRFRRECRQACLGARIWCPKACPPRINETCDLSEIKRHCLRQRLKNKVRRKQFNVSKTELRRIDRQAKHVSTVLVMVELFRHGVRVNLEAA